jgi:hypothetical protein
MHATIGETTAAIAKGSGSKAFAPLALACDSTVRMTPP